MELGAVQLRTQVSEYMCHALRMRLRAKGYGFLDLMQTQSDAGYRNE